MYTSQLKSKTLLPLKISWGSSKALSFSTLGYIHCAGSLAAHREISKFHRKPLNKKWRVTHLPTGLSLGIKVSSKEKSLLCMEQLAFNFDWNFNSLDEISSSIQTNMKNQIKKLNLKYK